MKKKIMYLITALVLIICTAGGMGTGVYAQEKESTEEKNEWKEIKEAITEYVEGMKGDKERTESDDGIREDDYKTSKAYKVNLLDNFMITNYYKNNGLQKSILKTVQWKVPLERMSGEKGVATFLKEEQGYKWIGESEGLNSYIEPESRQEIIKKFDQERIGQIQTMKYLYSSMYQFVLVLVQTNDSKYVVPYAEHPDKLVSMNGKYAVESGKIYKLSEFMSIMNHIFDEGYLIKHPNESAGLVYRTEGSKRGYVIAGGIVVVIGAAYLLIKQKRNGRRKRYERKTESR